MRRCCMNEPPTEIHCFRCRGTPDHANPMLCGRYLEFNGLCTWRRTAIADFKKVLAGDRAHITLDIMFNQWQGVENAQV